MVDEQPKQADEVTPKGAVEVDDEDLDQASGGAGYLKWDPPPSGEGPPGEDKTLKIGPANPPGQGFHPSKKN